MKYVLVEFSDAFNQALIPGEKALHAISIPIHPESIQWTGGQLPGQAIQVFPLQPCKTMCFTDLTLCTGALGVHSVQLYASTILVKAYILALRPVVRWPNGHVVGLYSTISLVFTELGS